jgi:hypothetical protein
VSVHPSADDPALRLALRIVGRLVRDGLTSVGDLTAALRRAGLDPDMIIPRLEQQYIAIARSASIGDDDAMRFWPLTPGLPTLPSTDGVILLESPIRDHVRATVNVDGRWVQEPAVEIDAAASRAIEGVVRAVESTAEGVPAEEIDHCRQALSRILFGDRTVAALARAVADGYCVHLRLHAPGVLAGWPWELATQAERVGHLYRGGMLGLSRLVGATAAQPLRPPGEPGQLRVDGLVDYTRLSRLLDLTDALDRWDSGLLRRPAPEELWSARRADPPAELTVLTGHGSLPEPRAGEPRHLLGCALQVEDGAGTVRAAQVADAVLARAPRAAMLGICHSATESASMPSLGRLVAAGGVEQVFAFRGKVKVEVLRQFAGELLEQLSLGYPTSYAAAKARQAIDGHLARAQLVVFGGGAGRP